MIINNRENNNKNFDNILNIVIEGKMSEKNKDTKVYTKVIKDIKEKILSGQLKNGDRLPSEREMAEKLEVSRTSIREAIRVLEIMGLIESKRGSGNYIANSFGNSLFEPLSIMFMLQEYSTEDIHELRETLEIECCRVASKKISDDDIKLLNDIIDKMYKTNDEEQSLLLDIRFHNIIVKSSDNPLIVNVLEVISQLMDKFIKESRKIILCEENNREVLLNSHKEIVLSLQERDEEKAIYSMKKHFEIIKKAYEKY